MELDPNTMEGMWARLVRPKVMPGTHLKDAQVDPATGGWVAWVVADDDVPAVPVPDRKLLVGALRSSMTLVDYQPHPSDPRRGKIRLMDKNPLEDGVPFPGPQALEPSKGGYIAIGRGVSGRVARLQMFDPVLGAQHIFIAGVTGSGKGGVVQIIALAAHLAGTAIIYADPKGSSNPDVEAMAAYAATGSDAIKSLRLAYALLQHRVAESARLGRKNFKATADCPWVMVIVDETHMITDSATEEGKEAVFILDKIAALGRNLGMTLLIVNQAVNADKLGGSTALRTNVIQGGAMVMLRTDSAQSNLITVDGFEGIDPGAIPAAWSAEDEPLVWSDDIPLNDPARTFGLGYVGSPGEPVQMMRSWILESAAPYIRHDAIIWPHGLARLGRPPRHRRAARHRGGLLHPQQRPGLGRRRIRASARRRIHQSASRAQRRRRRPGLLRRHGPGDHQGRHPHPHRHQREDPVQRPDRPGQEGRDRTHQVRRLPQEPVRRSQQT